MELMHLKELFRNREKYLNQTVEVCGWVRSVRNSKNFGFIVINDGTFFEPLQVVYGEALSNFGVVSKLNVGAAILVKGTLVPTPEIGRAHV